MRQPGGRPLQGDANGGGGMAAVPGSDDDVGSYYYRLFMKAVHVGGLHGGIFREEAPLVLLQCMERAAHEFLGEVDRTLAQKGFTGRVYEVALGRALDTVGAWSANMLGEETQRIVDANPQIDTVLFRAVCMTHVREIHGDALRSGQRASVRMPAFRDFVGDFFRMLAVDPYVRCGAYFDRARIAERKWVHADAVRASLDQCMRGKVALVAPPPSAAAATTTTTGSSSMVSSTVDASTTSAANATTATASTTPTGQTTTTTEASTAPSSSRSVSSLSSPPPSSTAPAVAARVRQTPVTRAATAMGTTHGEQAPAVRPPERHAYAQQRPTRLVDPRTSVSPATFVRAAYARGAVDADDSQDIQPEDSVSNVGAQRVHWDADRQQNWHALPNAYAGGAAAAAAGIRERAVAQQQQQQQRAIGTPCSPPPVHGGARRGQGVDDRTSDGGATVDDDDGAGAGDGWVPTGAGATDDPLVGRYAAAGGGPRDGRRPTPAPWGRGQRQQQQQAPAHPRRAGTVQGGQRFAVRLVDEPAAPAYAPPPPPPDDGMLPYRHPGVRNQQRPVDGADDLSAASDRADSGYGRGDGDGDEGEEDEGDGISAGAVQGRWD